MKLWVQVLIAVFLGTLCGLLFQEFGFSQAIFFFKPIGNGFLALIHMLILPLVFASMAAGIAGMHDPHKLGRVGGKTLFLYLATMFIAIVFGVAGATLLEPGTGLTLAQATGPPISLNEPPSIGAMLFSVIPTNPIKAFVDGNVLQVIFFAIVFGIAMVFAKEKAAPIRHLIDSLADIMYALTQIVMRFSPIGIFAIMVWASGSFGVQALAPMLKFLLSYYLVCLIHVAVVYCGMLWGIARLSPWPFFRGMGDAIAMAFSTCSSSATLPVALRCFEENLGISKSLASFVLPLGCTINMNGAAIYQGMSALFICQAYGITLSWYSLVTIVCVGTLSAVGAAGIPGTGFIMLSVVLSSVGIPLEGLLLLAGIDRVREMVSTVVNILGDGVCAVVIAKGEGPSEFDEEMYNRSCS